MADNLLVTQGAGTTVATDEIGGVHYQRAKQVFGVDGVATDVSASNPLPVVQTGAHDIDTVTTVTTVGAVTSITNALPTGSNQIGKLAANTGVDIGDVDVTSVTPGTGGTSLGKAVDSPAGATDTGVATLAVRDDALTTLTPADGDYVPLRVDSEGRLHTTASVTVGSVDVDSLPVSFGAGAVDATTQRMVVADDQFQPAGPLAKLASTCVTMATDEHAAHDAVDTGNPQKIGYKAAAGMSGATLVAAADRVNSVGDLAGALYVRTHCGLEDIVSGNASNTDGTSTEVIAAAGAGIKQYLTRVILTNMHASSTIYVEMKSGSTTKATIPCPPGGATVAFDPPLPPNADNEAWSFDPSAATTTIYCTAVGFKSKI